MKTIKDVIDKWKWRTHAEYNGVFVDNHDVNRFMHDQGGSTRNLKTALVLAMTMRGIPCVYYGTEFAYSGGKDPANRESLWPAFNDKENGPHEVQLLLARLNSFRKSYKIWDHQ